MKGIEGGRHIGIVGNPAGIGPILADAAEDKGYEPVLFSSAYAFRRKAKDVNPDAIIVSEHTNLPGRMKGIPRVVLGVGEKGSAAAALDAGALDYISPRILSEKDTIRDLADYVVAKIDQSILRDRNSKTITVGELEIDLRNRRVIKGGVEIKLEPKPLQILALLLEKAGENVLCEEIERRVWGKQAFYGDMPIRQHIYFIREALGKEHIQKVNGGYMYVEEPVVPEKKA